jgi:hypothetical protein
LKQKNKWQGEWFQKPGNGDAVGRKVELLTCGPARKAWLAIKGE